MIRDILVILIQIALLTIGPYLLFTSMIEHDKNRINFGDAPEYNPTNNYFRKRNYHMIGHSHNDPGWVFTFNEAHKKIEKQMEVILRNQKSGGYKTFLFTISDIIFLPGYEKLRPGSIKEIKELVSQKKIDIINCGMSMPDQALTHYDDLMNTFEYGREFCLEQLGVLPKVGWSIDPFGQSAYISRLFAEMGYTAQVINRIPFYQKAEFKRKKNMVFNWKGRYEEDTLPTYLTHMHYTIPTTPHGVTNMYHLNILEVDCNLFDRVLPMMMHSEDVASDYTSGESVFLMGDDFKFFATNEIYLFYGIYIILQSNSKPIFGGSTGNFSTMSNYLTSEKVANQTYQSYGPGKDFMPLIETLLKFDDKVWTGFYFFRPTFKLLAKDYGKFYRGMLEQLAWQQVQGQTGDVVESLSKPLLNSRITQGLMTHHDSVTGTALMYVLHDYEKIINSSVTELSESMAGLLSSNVTKYFPSDTVVVNKLDKIIYLLVSNGATRAPRTFRVKIADGCPSSGVFSVSRDNMNLDSRSIVVQDRVIGCELSFTDKDEFAPWERRVYTINTDSNYSPSSLICKPTRVSLQFEESVELQGTHGRVKISTNSTTITIEEMNSDQKSKKWSVNLWRYRETLDNLQNNIRSRMGQYTMRTLQHNPDPIIFTSAYMIRTGNNTVVTLQISTYPYIAIHLIHEPQSDREFRIRFSVKDLYQPKLNDYVMRINFAGLPRSNDYAKVFYTDSNGQDVMKREHFEDKPIEVSYRPFASFISIPTSVGGRYRTASILSDRPSGGTTPAPGVIEIGVARNNAGKDNYGVHEGCFDYNPVHTEFAVVWEDGSHLSPEDAVPGNKVRAAQLKADSSWLLAKLESPDRSLNRKGVSSDSQDYALLQGVKGSCGNASEISRLIRITLDSRSQGISVKIYNLNEFCTVKITDIQEFIKLRTGLESSKNITTEERSIDFNQAVDQTIKNDPTLLISPMFRELALKESTQGKTIILKPLKYKAFKVKVA